WWWPRSNWTRWTRRSSARTGWAPRSPSCSATTTWPWPTAPTANGARPSAPARPPAEPCRAAIAASAPHLRQCAPRASARPGVPRMLLIGVAGTELTAQERDWLQHDAVAGVVLFKRNFASREQVVELTSAIRAATARPLLLAVDQEGGRVQRFREGYTELPPLDGLGKLYSSDPAGALALAEQHAWLMASEVRASGLDLSFAPVVDVGHGNLAIGNRAFGEDPQTVAALTAAYVRGMHSVGMAATLKHFPGHGTVREDTHVDTAIDPRSLQEMESLDLVPFRAGIAAGADAVMM